MPKTDRSTADAFSSVVGAKENRKLRATNRKREHQWFGLSMFGLIGWSVVVPTLLGTAFGIWIDKHHPSRHSWTLALLVAGLMLGCFNAWYWIQKEIRETNEVNKNKKEEQQS